MIKMDFIDEGVATAPRKSVVKVYFEDWEYPLTYYNEKFDLKVGDIVYVEGKKELTQGVVTSVNYNYKIKVNDYKRVIQKADTNVQGSFYILESEMMTFDPTALPKEKVATWFLPPVGEDDEYECGYDDTSFELSKLSEMNVRDVIYERGMNYYEENRVQYICLDGTKGYAIVNGNKNYEVEFTYSDGRISQLTCSCFCVYNCKHEVAVMMKLIDCLEDIKKNFADKFEESGYFAMVRKKEFVDKVMM